MRFSFKTRGAVNPKGKPRVYFTCHPEDFSVCFPKLCQDILEAQDCVVYYTEDMSQTMDEQDKESSLGQMNLFAVPVTHRLLMTKNRAMDEDVAYAKQHNIPVLPFMMETGLDALYARSECFGEWQYLIPNSGDSTEIKYEDKLRKYLQTVLFSAEEADRIREAFDAYIFLSYRKKDRNYANNLMKLIHNIPEFQNIAIWYDEFLTPGESYQENIHRMLNESKLFALVVTPNLIEEHNYVKDVEYPLALAASINVIPAEMVKTDRQALLQSFKDLPDCVSPADAAGFASKMQLARKLAQIVEKTRDPAHKYLIGLAYLEGVDVEVDRQRGIALLTEAAEAAYPEAVEKLYRLYSGEDGNGFVDHRKAFGWGEKMVVHKEKLLGPEHPDTLTAKAKLAATMSALRNYADARRALEAIYQVRRRVLGENHPVTLTTLHNLALELINLKEYGEAAKLGEMVYALRCLVLGEMHPETIVTLHNLAENYYYLGEGKKAVNLLEKAYEQCRTVAGEMAVDTLRILDSLAATYQALGEPQKAMAVLEAVYAARQEKYGEASEKACNTLVDLAAACCKAGAYKKGFAYFEKATALYSSTFGPTSAYVQYAISRVDDFGFAAVTAEAWESAGLLWGKALELQSKCFGVWHHTTRSILNSLCELLGWMERPAQKEPVLNHISQVLMIMGNSLYYDTCTIDQKTAIKQMHELMRMYAKHYQNPKEYIALLEMMYRLFAHKFGPDVNGTQKYKKLLESTKAKNGV